MGLGHRYDFTLILRRQELLEKGQNSVVVEDSLAAPFKLQKFLLRLGLCFWFIAVL